MKALKDKFLDRKILDIMKPRDKNNLIIIINKLLRVSKDLNCFDPKEDIDCSFNVLYDIADDNDIFISTF